MAALVSWTSAPSRPGPVGGTPPTDRVLHVVHGAAEPTVDAVVPRPLRRLPRHRRPGEQVSAPVRRPGVASCGQPVQRGRFAALVVVGLASAAVVLGLAVLGSTAAGDGVSGRTVVVEVRGGETIWDVAHRVAPHSPQPVVVERIRQLNGLRGSVVHPGQPLVVPAGG